MNRRAETVCKIFVVFVLPFGMLVWVAMTQGIETHPFEFGKDSPGRVVVGTAVGCATGLWAGLAARSGVSSQGAFVCMAFLAGLNSWGVLFLVAGINSTSGYGIDPSWVFGTSLSWLTAFVSFFGTASLVQNCAPRRSLGE